MNTPADDLGDLQNVDVGPNRVCVHAAAWGLHRCSTCARFQQWGPAAGGGLAPPWMQQPLVDCMAMARALPLQPLPTYSVAS